MKFFDLVSKGKKLAQGKYDMKSESSRESLTTENIEENRPQKDEPQHAINPSIFDPYKNFKFRIKWDGKVVAGISKMSGLKRSTHVVEHREGTDPNSIVKSPGITRYDPVVLERGITHDLEFDNWACKVWSLDPNKPLKDFRKDIILELLDGAGQVTITYKVYGCWVSEYQALPDMDANANAVGIETIKIEIEGWERDK